MEVAALLGTAALLVAGAFYWFVCIMGGAEVKGKKLVDITMGTITGNNVIHACKQHLSFFERPKEALMSSDNVPAFVNTYYSLVTDIYEWGWGQSFHFSPSIPGRSHRDATRIHEERVVDLINARPGHRILDVGCGVGGPMRTIAARSGSNIVGITINEYQVKRARIHNHKAGLDGKCEVVCGNFLKMPFQDSSFDGVYSIEATCHAPRLEDVYAEIYRVLKPGGLYVSYEWVTTRLYRADDPKHAKTIKGFEKVNALPGLCAQDQIADLVRKVGFQVVEERDLALPPAGQWWTRLKVGRLAYWRNHILVSVAAMLRIAPKGLAEVHEMLYESASDLTLAGETGIFSPMYMILCRKPIVTDETNH